MPIPIPTIPSLSDDDWITDPINILDRAVAYAFASNASQSIYFKDNITSVSDIFAGETKEANYIVNTLEEKLSALLSRYFDKILVSATLKDDKKHPGTIMVQLFVQVTDLSGRDYKLNTLLKNKDSKLSIITDINNYGIN